MTPEQKQRIEEIRQAVESFTPASIGSACMRDYAKELLSLVKSQEAVEIKIRECAECGHDKSEHGEDLGRCAEWVGDEIKGHLCDCPRFTFDAATSMRSACLEKLRRLRDKAAGLNRDDPFVNGAVGAYNAAIRELESLSIEKSSL